MNKVEVSGNNMHAALAIGDLRLSSAEIRYPQKIITKAHNIMVSGKTSYKTPSPKEI